MGAGEPATKHRLDRSAPGALGRERPVEEHRDLVGKCRTEGVEVACIERREVAVEKCAEIARTVAIRPSHHERDLSGARYDGTRRTR